MESEPYAPERLRSAPTASASAVGTSLSGDESEGSGRHSSFGFQPRLPLPPGSRRTGSADTNEVAAPGKRPGHEKQQGHVRSASTEPGWQPLQNETRSKSTFGYQAQQHNTGRRSASPTGPTERNRAKPVSNFGYQPRRLKRVEKDGNDETSRDDGNDGVVRAKNFGYKPRQQESTANCRDAHSENELGQGEGGETLGEENCGGSTDWEHEGKGTVDAGMEVCMDAGQQNDKEPGCKERTSLLPEQHQSPMAPIHDAGQQKLGSSKVANVPRSSSQKGGPASIKSHSLMDCKDGNLDVPVGTVVGSVADVQGQTPMDEEEDFVHYEYAAPHAEEVGLKHPCMAEEPALPHGAVGFRDDRQSMTGASDLFSRSSGGFRSRTPESIAAMQYASELLDSQPRATPVNLDVEDSSSDEEIVLPEKQFPFSYMTGFNPTWLDSDSDTESERTRAYPPAANKNDHSGVSENEGCPVIHVNESKGKYMADQMDIDSSSDDYVLEEAEVVLQNLMSDQSAPRTPSVQEGRRSYLQASNTSARSAMTGSPSVESQRDEASTLLQKLMTRSSMTSRSAEDDVNSPYDRKTAARLSLLSRSSGRSGGWDELMDGVHGEGAEGACDGPGMEAALQKLMVSVHRMNEEARDGTTAEKTVSSWLQEDRLDGEVNREQGKVDVARDAKTMEEDRALVDCVADEVAKGALEDYQTTCVGHPIVASELSYSYSEDDTVDDGRAHSPISSVGHANWEAVEGDGTCPEISDEDADDVKCQGTVDDAPCEGGGQSQPADLKPSCENTDSVPCDGPSPAPCEDTEIVPCDGPSPVVAESVPCDGPSPAAVEEEEDGCDVVMVTARDLCVISPSASVCNDDGIVSLAPSPAPHDVHPAADVVCEISSGDTETEIAPVPLGVASSVQRPCRVEMSEPRKAVELGPVSRTHRRAVDLPLQLDKGWMSKPCLAVRTRRKSADFEASGMNPPRSPLHRRVNIVLRMDDQWHYGGRTTKGRRDGAAVQPNGDWVQPVLNALYAPVHGIYQALGLGKNG
ncbi:unnamed protein product [Ostreobium quekettii]|uniref:Uncharacterized protein n=1 Tax=Ostreobium quekettii TaxID=121088 RepID=A0A8S1J5U0_9CHLO|nr:unnamed protein product [Ostreobium quekettii]